MDLRKNYILILFLQKLKSNELLDLSGPEIYLSQWLYARQFLGWWWCPHGQISDPLNLWRNDLKIIKSLLPRLSDYLVMNMYIFCIGDFKVSFPGNKWFFSLIAHNRYWEMFTKLNLLYRFESWIQSYFAHWFKISYGPQKLCYNC